MKLVINAPDISFAEQMELYQTIEDFAEMYGIPVTYHADYTIEDDKPKIKEFNAGFEEAVKTELPPTAPAFPDTDALIFLS